MTVSEAKKKWRNAARAEKAGSGYVCTGNMRTLDYELRWFSQDDHATIELAKDSSPFGQFTDVIRVIPNPDKKRVLPFLLLVS